MIESVIDRVESVIDRVESVIDRIESAIDRIIIFLVRGGDLCLSIFAQSILRALGSGKKIIRP